jgi:hypothetical protein
MGRSFGTGAAAYERDGGKYPTATRFRVKRS